MLPSQETARTTRVLFTSDTHLGIDRPSRPRVERRRRGEDFFANFERVIAPVFSGQADIFVHGGDVFFRSRIPAWLAHLVFQRLADIADTGTAVIIVPGNHERSAMPRGLFLTHPGIHVFDVPRTFVVERHGVRTALSGFPYTAAIRTQFGSLLAATQFNEPPADIRLLCFHQLVEGARVGPSNYTFRAGADILPGASIPHGFAAVLSGHIHRFQVLECDLRGQRLQAPVFYSGSIERTSFAERDEPKGFLQLDISPGPLPWGRVDRWEFCHLPARPMIDLQIEFDGVSTPFELERTLRERLLSLPPDSVVRIRLLSDPPPDLLGVLRAESIRSLCPAGMNLDVSWPASRVQQQRTLSYPGLPVRAVR